MSAYTPNFQPATKRVDQKQMKSGEVCVCFNVRKASRSITQLYDELLRPIGLRSTQLSILGTAVHLEPVTVKILAEAVVIDRTTLARNLKVLEKRCLLRIGMGMDRRERVITVTDKGQEELSKAFKYWKKAQVTIVKNIGKKRVERLLSDLSNLVKALRQK